MSKIPYRLERYNRETESWEIFWTKSKAIADTFMDETDLKLYTSVGYVANPQDKDWIQTYAAMGYSIYHYDHWRTTRWAQECL